MEEQRLNEEPTLVDVLSALGTLQQDQARGRQRLLWMRDVTERTGRSRDKILEWVKAGRLDMRRVDGEWCIHADTFEANLRDLIESGQVPGRQRTGRPKGSSKNGSTRRQAGA